MTTITYLAAPYSHTSPVVMEWRVAQVDAAAVALMDQGFVVFSPLSQWHRPAQIHSLPTNANFWIGQNRAMLGICDMIHILQLPGWEDSQGIAMERAWAEAAGKPVVMMEADR